MTAPDIALRRRRATPGRTLRAFISAGVIAALAFTEFAAGRAVAHAAEPDYTGWQALLQRYLRIVQPKGGPWDSRFDYEQLFIDENIWARGRADGLTTLHTQLLSVSPAAMTPGERRAWAINAYNFLVIERMTLNLLVPGRKFMRHDSPRQVNKAEGTFFAAPVATLDGQSYTLTGFERRFVYGDTAADPMSDGSQAREQAGDPRLMFALVKASLCSGPLLPWAYRADSLEMQLDRAARIALALPTWLRPDPAAGMLAVSNRLFEERADFGGPQLPGLLPFIRKHGPTAARRVTQARKLAQPSIFFEPDWRLNQFDHPKPKLPGESDSDSAKAGRSR